MRYFSTNRNCPDVGAREAIMSGLAPDGGLYMPSEIPELRSIVLNSLHQMSLAEIGFEVAKLFLSDEIPDSLLEEITHSAINFDAPLVELAEGRYILELFHGPTLAFKDFAARFMARVVSHFKQSESKETTILVATSGDTGAAVASGFYQVEGIRVVLLYPKGLVSAVQEKQLTTFGANVSALEVEGTFDDCQRMVKEAFVDDSLKESVSLGSANSINVARLIPQSFYYLHSGSRLNSVKSGRKLVFSIPSGNFGNLTAGLLAKRMGLSVDCFVAATNANDVIPEYLKTGVYKSRPAVATISNAMDIGDPSNYVRIANLYSQSVSAVRRDIFGIERGYSDDQTREGIREVYNRYQYLIDPHGTVGYLALKEFTEKTKQDFVNGVILETAHPAKFSDTVSEVLEKEVEFPKALEDCMAKDKQALLIDSNYNSLREFLVTPK